MELWQAILAGVGVLMSIVGVFLSKVLTQLLAFLLDFAKNSKGAEKNGNGNGNHAVTHLMLQQMEKRDDAIILGQRETNVRLDKLATIFQDAHVCPLKGRGDRLVRLKALRDEIEDEPVRHELDPL